MKSLQPINDAPGTTVSSPFFKKKGGDSFFGNSNQPEPFFSSNPIQAKLSIGEPNDVYEKEADAVADKVVKGLNENQLQTRPKENNSFSGKNNENIIQPKPVAPVSSITPFVQTKCAACEQEEKLQKKEEVQEEGFQRDIQKQPIFESNAEPPPDDDSLSGDGKGEAIQRKCAECEEKEKLLEESTSADIERSLNSSKGFGSPLPSETRAQMESSFGADFSDIRIHNDSASAKMSQNLNAQAFTNGNDIYFNSGKYDPGNREGQHLLAHELTHAQQQGAVQPQTKSRLNGNRNATEPLSVEQGSQRQNSSSNPSGPTSPSVNGQNLNNANRTTNTTASRNAVIEQEGDDTTQQLSTSRLQNTPANTQEANTTAPAQTATDTAPQRSAATARANSTPSQTPPPVGETAADAGGGSGPMANEAPPETTPLNTSSGPALLQSLAGQRATGLITVINEAVPAAAGIQQAEKQTLQNSLPVIEQPTGLPTVAENSAEPILPENETAQSPLLNNEAAPDTGYGETPHPVSTEPVVAVQIPHPTAENSAGFGQNVHHLITQLPTSDSSVITSAGARPSVDLSGNADPTQNEENQAQYGADVDSEHATAQQAVSQDFGEHNIYPRIERETLSAGVQVAAPQIGSGESLPPLPTLPGNLYQSFDMGAESMLRGEVGTQMAVHESEHAQMVAQSEEERQSGMDRIAAENNQTRIEQEQIQSEARSEVQDHRQAWLAENEEVRLTYSNASTQARSETDEQINTQIETTNTDVESRLSQAEEQAEAERVRVENDAARRRREAAERPEPGFWESAANLVSDFFDALRDALNSLFDGLRAFVREVIDLAKEAVNALIDLARDAITGLIRAFGEVLKALVDVALAAFPEIAARINSLIDDAVNFAVDRVNELADALKEAVSAILDAIGAVLDTILSAYQAIYNAILDALEAVALAILEAMRRIGYLVEAASQMPDHFWGKVQEETIGIDPTQPLPFERTRVPAPQDEASAGATAAVESGQMTPQDATLLSQSTFTGQDIQVEPVTREEFDPEFISSLNLSENGTVEFGHSTDPEHSMDALLAEAAGTGTPATPTAEMTAGGREAEVPSISATPQATEETATGNGCPSPEPQPGTDPCAAGSGNHEAAATPQEIPEEMRTCGPLTPSERRSFMFAQMRQGISQWFECHKVQLIAGMIALLVGLVVAEILTGGAITAALPLIMEIIGAIMLGAAMVRISGFLLNYLTEGWAGNIIVSAQNLAHGLAAGAVELIFALIFNIGAVIKAIRSGFRGATRAAATAVRNTVTGTIRAARQLGTVARTGARTAIRNGRLLLQGTGRGFMRGIRSLDDLGRRLISRFRFRRFRIRRRGFWFVLEGYINPWVVIMEGPMRGQMTEVDDALVAGRNVGEDLLTHGDHGTRMRILSMGSDVPTNYRRNFEIFHNLPEGSLTDSVIHHMIEQQTRGLSSLIDDVFLHAPGNLRAIPRGEINSIVHLSQIRIMWNNVYTGLRGAGFSQQGMLRGLMHFERFTDQYITYMLHFARQNSHLSGDALKNLLRAESEAWLHANNFSGLVAAAVNAAR